MTELNPDNFSGLDVEELSSTRDAFLRKFPEECREIADACFATIVPIIFKVNVKSEVKSHASTRDDTGYDPIVTLSTFLKRAKDAAAVSGSWEIKDDSGAVVFTIKKGADWVNDLALFVLIFMIRGSKMWKILLKIQNQWIEPLKEKCSIYGIRIDKVSAKRPLGPRDLTLARLAGTVPHYVMAFMIQGVGKIYVNVKRIEKAYGFIYPLSCLTQMMAAMVPTSGTGSELLHHCYVYSFLFDRVTNPNRQISDFQDYVKSQQSLVDASNKSQLYPDSYRRSILDANHLLDFDSGSWKFSEIGEIVRRAGSELWIIIRGSDSVKDAMTSIDKFLTGKSPSATQISIQTPKLRPAKYKSIVVAAQSYMPRLPEDKQAKEVRDNVGILE